MLRIAGITIPENKRLEIGLTAIYGIGRNRAKEILNNLKIEHGRRPSELSAGEENDVRKAVEEFKIEGDLKREVSSNIKRLKDIKSYVGVRHSRGLPVRGQRTKTNARTRKGPKKTMGSGKKKVDKK
ncbi:MAG: small subunit ribosomal protein [Patescibacteria group bacterium]|nr:small subunit ribosomal protein [Patescibacteria group bacterium]